MKGLCINSTDPTYNLALEEALFQTLEEGQEGYFLLWRNSPSVIIGRHQNTPEEINETYVNAHDIPVVRRGTGGGAVYHDLGNLNFSFLTWVPKGEDTGFARLLTPIVAALRELGINAELSSRNDITVEGKKISGNAQRKSGQKLLQHGTLLISLDTSHLSDILTGNPDKYRSKGVSSHKSRVANLIDFMPEKNPEYAMKLLQETLLRHCSTSTVELTPEVETLAQTLQKEKYSSWNWNYGHSPVFQNSFRTRFSWGAVECGLEIVHGIVKSCRIFGDFFSYEDIAELEAQWVGIPHTPASFRQKAESLPLEKWFNGATKSELVEFFSENILSR